MKNTKYMLKKYVHSVEPHESLNYEPFYKAFGDDFWDDVISAKYITKGVERHSWGNEVSPVSITDMEDIIKEMKKKGATHLEIMYHGDHDSYCVTGVEIRTPFQYEIDKHCENELILSKKILEKKRETLMKELTGIDIQLGNII